MNKKCQAKDPRACRFHSREAYRQISADLEIWKVKSTRAGDFERLELANQFVARFSLFKDSTKVGFKNLTKEYNRTMAKGSEEEKLNISARLHRANELLLADDERGSDVYLEWGERCQRGEDLAEYVIEQSEETSTVKIPDYQAGSFLIVDTVVALNKAGYKVTDLRLSMAANPSSLQFSSDVIKKMSLENLTSHSSDEIVDFILNNNSYVRGLTFLNKQNKEVKLVGSSDLSHELRYGNADRILNISRKPRDEY